MLKPETISLGNHLRTDIVPILFDIPLEHDMRRCGPVFCSFLLSSFAVVPVSGTEADLEETGVRQERVERILFRIDSADAVQALEIFSEQAKVPIVFLVKQVEGISTNAVDGVYTAREALDKLIAGSALAVVEDEKIGVLLVKRAEPGNRSKRATAIVRADNANSSSENGDTTPTMNRKTRKTGGLFAGLLTLALVNSPELAAQDDSSGNDVFELSPFEVDSSQDTGYRATNTLSGSRLNTSLRDTAASVSVWTKEFVEDVGLNDIEELMAYSIGSEIDTDDDEPGGGLNTVVNVQKSTSQKIRTRGIQSTKGLDYFVALGPDDSYRVGRYDESRGPNGILFGVSNAGGLTNQTSIAANTQRNSGKVSLSIGSNDRSRATINLNRVLVEGKLAFALAAVNQENGGWRTFDFDDKERVFGTVTYKANDRITLRGSYETGRDVQAVVKPITSGDSGLGWWDNGANTLLPANRNSTAAEKAVGIANRNGNDNGNNHRYVFIEDNATVFDSVGTFLTQSYNQTSTIAPDGTPGGGGQHLINDTSFLPYEVNAAGSSSFRDTALENYTLFADFKVTDKFFVNVSHNYQKVVIDIPYVNGVNPLLRGDPNTTLGVGTGLNNPYAGMLYFEAEYFRDSRTSTSEETRLSASYDINTERLGQHRIGAMVSQTELFDIRINRNLALGGDPFNNGNTNYTDANNLLRVRKYITDINDPYSFRMGDWRAVPDSVTIEGVTYPTVWAHKEWVNNNGIISNSVQNQASDTNTDTALAVLQSHFFNRRLVTTFGYREDTAANTPYGYLEDPLIGWKPDIAGGTVSLLEYSGQTRTSGIVFHLNDHFSLIGNSSTNIGIPEFNRIMLPDGLPPLPADGEGEDFGIGFDLFDRKLSGRLVYYTTKEIGISNGGNHRAFNDRIGDGLGEAFVDNGDFANIDAWEDYLTQRNLSPFWNGRYQDTDSKGYELSLVANPTQNWSLIFNASKTDRRTVGAYQGEVDYFGFMLGNDGLLAQGASEGASGWTLDPEAFTSDGAVSRWLDIESEFGTADFNFSTITTSADGGDRTVAEEIYEIVEVINDFKLANEKRWGLRPYKVKLWSTYNFSEGPLKGFSVGGGYRWSSPNVMDEIDGVEIEGEPIIATDLMLRYKIRNGIGPYEGSLSFQLNVSNIFDNTDIIPQRFTVDSNYLYPGGDRGIAYRRYDLVAPREVRFTTTYDF